MANIPYYADPIFKQKLAALQAPGNPMSSPFSSTQRAVAARLYGQGLNNTNLALRQNAADAGYNTAQFNTNQAWKSLFGNINREADMKRFDAQRDYEQAMQAKARSAAKRNRRRGMIAQGINLVAGTAGTIFGGPVGGAVASGASNAITSSLF